MDGIWIKVSKDVLAGYQERIVSGKPILPPENGWTPDDLLALGAVCDTTAMCMMWDAVQQKIGDLAEDQENEHADSFERAACHFEHCAFMVADGTYDELFEPVHEVCCFADKIGPGKGVKNPEQYEEPGTCPDD